MSVKKKGYTEREATFTIYEYPPKTLFLRESIASGKLDKSQEEFEVSINVSGDSLIFRLGKGKWYLLSVFEFVDRLVPVAQKFKEKP